jgi:DNA-directed RNA polymerase I subunit RPA1
VLDKSQFGASAFGLVHAVYELHGAQTAGLLLSTLSRLFTIYGQQTGLFVHVCVFLVFTLFFLLFFWRLTFCYLFHWSILAFTCSIEDMLLKDAGEKERKSLLDKANLEGFAVAAKFTSKTDEQAVRQALSSKINKTNKNKK